MPDERESERNTESVAKRKAEGVLEAALLHCDKQGRNRSFAHLRVLNQHKKTRCRPYKCTYDSCDSRGFARTPDLERHINEVHNTEPRYYECDYCYYKSKRTSDILQHMGKQHYIV